MTPEELARAVEAGDQDAVIRLIAAAPEADRRKAATTAVRLKRELYNRFLYGDPRRISIIFDGKRTARFQQQDEAAGLAILGTCALAEMKRLRGLDNRESAVPQRALEVLHARRPNWLSAWAEWKVEDGCPSLWLSGESTSPWLVVRGLIRAGLIDRPSSDGYIASMIGCYEPLARERWVEVLQKKPRVQHAPDRLHVDALHQILHDDPALLDDEVWRLFEVEGIGNISLAANGPTWQTVLLELCSRGRLDRQRLLTYSLEALQRDFSPYRAGWFARFHEAMTPTLEERAARTEIYLALAGSTAPATVSFALKALAALDRAGQAPAQRLVACMGPALTGREKGTASLALRLLARAAKRSDGLKSDVALAASEALEHSESEVQSRAIELLEAPGMVDDPAVRAVIARRAQGVTPSLKSRIAALLRAEDVAGATEGEEARLTADLECLLRRAEQIDPARARLAGVVEALRAVRRCEAGFTGLALPFGETPRLAPERRQVPVTTLDDLIDLFAAVLEHEGPAEDVERVLDGVSRLCADRPSDFERRTSALRKRADTLMGGHPQNLFNGNGVQSDLCGLALAWTIGKIHGGEPLSMPDRTWGVQLPLFLSARVMEVARNAVRRQSRPLLAAPTHAGGWIDPVVAVERFRERIDVNHVPDRAAELHSRVIPHWREFTDLCDIVQALLRLAPDGGEAVLRLAHGLHGEVGEALRYALGAEDVAIGPTLPLWVAAARARAPREDDERVERRFPRLGPGGGRAGRADVSWPERQRGAYNYGEISYDPPLPRTSCCDLPTCLHFSSIYDDVRWELRSAGDMRWMATVWPQCRYPWWITGTLSCGRHLDWSETSGGDVAILEMMVDPDEALTGPAADALAVALAAKEPGQSTAAVDVLITAIADTRLDGVALGQALVAALRIENLKPPRWAKTLAEASRASLLHAFVIREAIERVLSSCPRWTSQQRIGLLELLVELGAQTGMGVSDPHARAYLRSIEGGGKTARLAKTLLALPPLRCPMQARRAAVQILTSRIERAERWQRLAGAR